MSQSTKCRIYHVESKNNQSGLAVLQWCGYSYTLCGVQGIPAVWRRAGISFHGVPAFPQPASVYDFLSLPECISTMSLFWAWLKLGKPIHVGGLSSSDRQVRGFSLMKKKSKTCTHCSCLVDALNSCPLKLMLVERSLSLLLLWWMSPCITVESWCKIAVVEKSLCSLTHTKTWCLPLILRANWKLLCYTTVAVLEISLWSCIIYI